MSDLNAFVCAVYGVQRVCCELVRREFESSLRNHIAFEKNVHLPAPWLGVHFRRECKLRDQSTLLYVNLIFVRKTALRINPLGFEEAFGFIKAWVIEIVRADETRPCDLILCRSNM